MKLLVASSRDMPDDMALVVMLATSDEVRSCEWASGDEAGTVVQAAYNALMVSLTDVESDE